jgi:hypothetical protein
MAMAAAAADDDEPSITRWSFEVNNSPAAAYALHPALPC